MKVIFLRIGVVLLNVIYSFFKLLRSRNKITFISRQSNDITLDYRLLGDCLNNEMPDYEVVFLCKKLDNKFKYVFHMFKQMYHIATSKVVILDSYCIAISVLNHKKSLKVIQIWHAVGSMKKFGYAMIGKEEGYSQKIATVLRMHKNYDYVLISSMSFVKDFVEGFGISKDKVIEIPLPRVDLLLDSDYKLKKRAELYERIPKLRGKKNILYCGTFRKEQQNNSKNIDDLVECIDFSKYNLLYKPHPFNTVRTSDERIIQDFESTFEALMVADYVICDYSSIIYEAGLLGLPVYIYAYDWEDYKTKRELNFDMEHTIPTLFTKNPHEIINAIENDEFDYKKFKDFVDKNVSVPSQGCCSEIIRFIKKII